MVKSQVFLLLGAACKHENGLDAVLKALEVYKVGAAIEPFLCCVSVIANAGNKKQFAYYIHFILYLN